MAFFFKAFVTQNEAEDAEESHTRPESSVRNVKLFNPEKPYDLQLKKMRKNFIIEWTHAVPSLETGIENFKFIRILGTGSYGSVKLMQDEDSKNLYAVKTIQKAHIVKINHVKYIMTEKLVLRCSHFPFIMDMAFSSKDNDYLYLVLPFVEGGTLFTYHRKVRRFGEKQTRFYAMQVFLALEYLHFMNILYRDLKPENIIINVKGYIKVTDFGFSKKIDERTLSLVGTPEYLAPEIINSVPYGVSIDWWAYGILLYELVDGESPFANHCNDHMCMYGKISDGDYTMSKYFSSSLVDLITNLLKPDVSMRLGCSINGNSDIKNHDWFKDHDWFSILNQEVPPPYLPVPEEKPKEDLVAEVMLTSNTVQYKHEFAKF